MPEYNIGKNLFVLKGIPDVRLCYQERTMGVILFMVGKLNYLAILEN